MYAVAVVVVVYVGKILRYSSVLVSYDACQPAALVVVVTYFFSIGVFYGGYSSPFVVFSVCFQGDGVAAVWLHDGVAFMVDVAEAVVFVGGGVPLGVGLISNCMLSKVVKRSVLFLVVDSCSIVTCVS